LIAAEGAFHIIASDPCVIQLTHAQSASAGESNASHCTRESKHSVLQSRPCSQFPRVLCLQIHDRSLSLSLRRLRRCRQCRGSRSASLLKHKRQVLENAFHQFFHCSRVELALPWSLVLCSVLLLPSRRLAGRLLSHGC